MIIRYLPLLLVLCPTTALAREPEPIAPKPVPLSLTLDPRAIAARDAFIDRETSAMGTLAAWAVMSVATGAALWASGGDEYTRAVGMQNVAWGAIDGVIAGFGYRGTLKNRFLDKPFDHWRAEDRKLTKIFWINTGLDVLYVTTGALMVRYGKNDLIRGSGAGIVLQGSFLLSFDAAMALGAK